ncbi:hypothetical protein [Acinetobacter sp. ANC 5502]
MSELISGKEAKPAWANGRELEISYIGEWMKFDNNHPLTVFDREDIAFRLKPRTITLNGIEVPVPFEPSVGDMYWFICCTNLKGFYCKAFKNSSDDECYIMLGAWRTEEEIKQVVAALRQVFKGADQ